MPENTSSDAVPPLPTGRIAATAGWTQTARMIQETATQMARMIQETAASCRHLSAEADRISEGREASVSAVLDQCAVALDGAAEHWLRFMSPALAEKMAATAVALHGGDGRP